MSKVDLEQMNNLVLETINDYARDYFWNRCKLTYSYLNKCSFGKLMDILEEHISKRNAEEKKKSKYKRDYTYKLAKCSYKKDKKGQVQAFINVKVDNSSVREGISFNSNLWIGFAGWASIHNTKLFTEAFIEWCDWVVKMRENNLL